MSIIKQERRKREFSRRQLAHRLDISENVLVRLEMGQVPTIIQAQKIKQVLRIPYDKLANDYIYKESE